MAKESVACSGRETTGDDRRAKTFRCEGCGDRFAMGEMFEVMDPGHLTLFEGDSLCKSCALNHGVL